MNDTATWPGVVPNLDGKKDASRERGTLIISVVLLVLALAGVIWMRFSHMGDWIIVTGAAPVLGVAGYLLGRRASTLR